MLENFLDNNYYPFSFEQQTDLTLPANEAFGALIITVPSGKAFYLDRIYCTSKVLYFNAGSILAVKEVELYRSYIKANQNNPRDSDSPVIPSLPQNNKVEGFAVTDRLQTPPLMESNRFIFDYNTALDIDTFPTGATSAQIVVTISGFAYVRK